VNFTTAQLAAFIGSFMWPFMRVGAMAFVAPVFSNRVVPARIRLLVAVALTVAVMPAAGRAPAVDPISAAGLLLAVHQMVIGLAMGFLLNMAFQVVVIAGESISLSMGLGFGVLVDPQSGQSTPVLSQFLLYICILLFLAVGGDLMLVKLLAVSFRDLPLAGPGMGAGDLLRVVAWASRMFAGAVLIALPPVGLLLCVNIALGVMTRTAPQMNIFSVGFPLTILVGFIAVLTLVLPWLPERMAALWSNAFAAVGALHVP